MLCKSCRFCGYQPQPNNNRKYKNCQGILRIIFSFGSSIFVAVFVFGRFSFLSRRLSGYVPGSVSFSVSGSSPVTGVVAGFQRPKTERDTATNKSTKRERKQNGNRQFWRWPRPTRALRPLRSFISDDRARMSSVVGLRLSQGFIKPFCGRSVFVPCLSVAIGRPTNTAAIFGRF